MLETVEKKKNNKNLLYGDFLVNLRHILMSSTLAPFLGKCSKRFLMFFSHKITDETFAINLINFRESSWTPKKAIIFNDMIINFVLTSMFICLLCLQVKGFIYVLCAIISGVLAVSLSFVINNNLYVIIATLLATTICYFIEKFIKEG